MPSSLLDNLTRVASQHATGEIWIAYSGGMDSRVLLQLAVEAGLNREGRLRAVHIHHGLQAQADGWAQHCRSVCEQLGVELQVRQVQVDAGNSLENQARIARYRVFESLLAEGDLLLQGHHADDQAETLLLRLMRGSGVRGLAAIPESRPLGRGQLLRPLLACSRQRLADYAAERQLRWIEDPSNLDTRHDRNYLRAQVLPQLKQRWPGAVASLGLSARNSAAAQHLCQELAVIDLQRCLQSDAGLSIAALRQLSMARRDNLLRYWLQVLTGVLPDAALLQRLWLELVDARTDAQPQMRLGVRWLRRFEAGLYLLPELTEGAAGQVWGWKIAPNRSSELWLPGGRLQSEPVIGSGLALPEMGLLQVSLRRGGERIRLQGRTGSRSLKKLLQERGVAPWQRSQLPLLYAGERLLAVADLWLAEGCLAAPGQPGIQLRWEPQAVPLRVPLRMPESAPGDDDF
ncbi:MAG: tRNA(Ile)-lysidine synthase [Motiliproteus sp.]|jgi:tRNA(Ile)-lysidine synthase